jgi:hypothetical protein
LFRRGEERRERERESNMGNLWCGFQSNGKKSRGKSGVRDVAFEAGNEVSSSVVVEMTSRRLSNESPTRKSMKKDVEKDEDNSFGEPNVISRLFMYWVLPFVRRSFSSPLLGKDMPRLRKELRSEPRLNEAKLMWDDMVEDWKSGSGSRPSLYRMMWRMNRTWCIVGLLLGVLQGMF